MLSSLLKSSVQARGRPGQALRLRSGQALHLHIYPGDGESWLYEDDGHSWAYQAGEFRLTHFCCELPPPSRRPSAPKMTVRRTVEGSYDPGYSRFEINLHALPAAPRRVFVDGQSVDTTFDPEHNTVCLTATDWTMLEVR